MGLALALRMFDARMHARSKRLKTVSQVLTGQYACLNWIAMALIADELMVPLGEQTKVGIKCAAARDLHLASHVSTRIEEAAANARP